MKQPFEKYMRKKFFLTVSSSKKKKIIVELHLLMKDKHFYEDIKGPGDEETLGMCYGPKGGSQGRMVEKEGEKLLMVVL